MHFDLSRCWLEHTPYAIHASRMVLYSHAVLQHFSKFVWFLSRPANLTLVPCILVSFARVPDVQVLDCPAVPAVQLSASRDRCLMSPQQEPWPVNPGPMRTSGRTWRSYPRRCGDQADPPMMVATLAQTYTQLQCICMGLRRHNLTEDCGVMPPLRKTPS